MNHIQYDQRMNFIKSILHLNDIEAVTIEPVEYDPNCPFPFNNFIYHVTLRTPTISEKTIRSSESDICHPGTSPLPVGTLSLIIRLTNHHPGTGLNGTNRVENEVAFLNLVRQALATSKFSRVIPDVYTWASMSSGQGFTMLQHMPGTMLDKDFDEMTLSNQKIVLGQMADILALIQKFMLPDTVESIGGLKFNNVGKIISGQMTLLRGGPFESYVDFIKAMFTEKLAEADDNPIIDGWRANEVRARLTKYIDFGLGEILKDVKDIRKVLVHSDLTTNNLLFDASTLQITALLDFDFSHIATVADEFMGYSFGNMSGGKLPAPYSGPPELLLRKAMLSNFANHFPSSTEDDSDIQWGVAKAWDDELARGGAARPCTIEGFDKIADIYWLLDNLCPFMLANEPMRKRKSEEQLKAVRAEIECLIMKYLKDSGF